MMPLRDCKTANDWNGGRGYWSEASAEPTSPHYLAVKRSLTQVATLIVMDTLAVARWGEIKVRLCRSLFNVLLASHECKVYMIGLRHRPHLLEDYAGLALVIDDTLAPDEAAVEHERCGISYMITECVPLIDEPLIAG